MHTLPIAMIRISTPFAPLFSRGVFQHALVLLAGTILAPGKRTVAAALRAMGLWRANGPSIATIGFSVVPPGL